MLYSDLLLYSKKKRAQNVYQNSTKPWISDDEEGKERDI